MKRKILRCALAGVGSVAMVVGMSVMVAQPASGFANDQTFEFDGIALKRIVKHVNPTITRANIVRGDVIMLVTEVDVAKVGGAQIPLRGVTEFYTPCLKFVPNTATVKRGAEAGKSVSVNEGSGQLEMTFDTPPVAYGTTTRIQSTYTVTDSCEYDVPFNVGMKLTGANGAELLRKQSLGDSVVFQRHTTTLSAQAANFQDDATYSRVSVLGTRGIETGDSVSFTRGGQPLCDGVFNGFMQNGQQEASCVIGTLPPAGVYNYEAKFAETNTKKSSSSRSTMTVWRNSTTALSASADAWAGQATTLTATVSPAGNGGTVEFSNGAVVLGSSPVEANGKATYSWVPAAGGAQTITAKYSGGTYTHASEGPLTINVGITGSTTTLSASADARVGQENTLTAAVSPAEAGGTVEFSNGGVPLGSSPVAANGKASYTWVPTTAGDKAITATFSGRPGVSGSTAGALTLNVLPILGSSTELTASANPWVGRTTTLTAVVSPGGAGGTVKFSNGAADLGSSPVESDGTATYSWVPTAAGNQTITATFSGRPGVEGSLKALPLNVGEDSASSTDLSASAKPWVGRTTTLSAAVTAPGSGGTVEFSNGTVVLGSSPVESDGTATYSWVPTAAGNQTITATFSGRTDVKGSTKSLAVSVGEDAVSSTRLSIAGNPWVGVANTLTADVSPAGAGGTVEFSNGPIILGTVVVGEDGKAAQQWTPTTAGNQTITAKFSGRDDVKSSDASLPLNVGVVAESTTTLSVELNRWGLLEATLTVRVSPGAEGDTVELSAGNEVLGTVRIGRGGAASYSWMPAEPGVYTVTAKFSGRDGVKASETSQVVSMGGVQTNTVLTSSGELTVGKPVTLTATVDAFGTEGTVTFKDGDTVLGWAPVNTDGTATMVWTPTASGKRALAAEYSGTSSGGSFRPSTGTLEVQIGGSGTDVPDGGGSLGNIFGSLGGS